MFAAAVCSGCAADILDSSVYETRGSEIAATGVHTPRPSPNDAGLGYYEYLPAGYETGAQFPLIVFFHGVGECGNGNTQLFKVLGQGVPKLIDNGRDFPAIVISPQAPVVNGGCTWLGRTGPFVDYILDHYNVDRSRIYITGLSLGGQGTWDYVRRHPSTVAAAVPICGPRAGTGYEVLRGKPIWAFHGELDGTVPDDVTADIVREITAVDPRPLVPGSTAYFDGTRWEWRTGELAPRAGETPAFTLYRGVGHNSWPKAYANEAMWTWLFQQRLGPAPEGVVFDQDFQSSTSVSSYVGSQPTSRQVNDLSAEPNGGTFSINQGRLQLVRTGSAAADRGAGLTRWTDFAGPPTALSIAFDVGVSGWTTSPFQSGAMFFNVGALIGLNAYGNGDVAANTFHGISVKGEGQGQFSVISAGIKSPPLAANGTLHHVALFLNRSGAGTSYRAPDGSLRALRNAGAALWVDGAPVVIDGAAANGASSQLTDLRLRWATGDNGTWLLDNLVIRSGLPQ